MTYRHPGAPRGIARPLRYCQTLLREYVAAVRKEPVAGALVTFYLVGQFIVIPILVVQHWLS